MTRIEYSVAFADLSLDDLERVGGKNASLGEMIASLGSLDIRVPGGFALTVEAFRAHLARGGLQDWINRELEHLDVDDTVALARTARVIRRRIHDTPLPADVRDALMTAYRELSARYAEEATDVAVRSSATAEDLPTASFAGQQDTFLCVHGEAQLDAAVRGCMASLYTDRAIAYRAERGIAHRGVLLSVGVQKMVRSDTGSAGVLFTLDTESGCRDVVVITGAWGLGELIVQGRVNPDEFWVHKPTAQQGHRSIIRRELGEKAVKLVPDAGARGLRQVRVPVADRRRFVLDDEDIMTLAGWGMTIEAHYSKRAGRDTPMDIEWAKDGVSGELFVVQARPETVHAQKTGARLAVHRLRETGTVLTTGKAVGSGIAAGLARVVHTVADLPSVQDGEVLVAEMTDPDWNPVLKRAAAVVTNEGGRTCHAAIVARELGIPCTVGTGNATAVIQDGDPVTLSCAGGDRGVVYRTREAAERGRGVAAHRVPGERRDRRAPDGARASRARRGSRRAQRDPQAHARLRHAGRLLRRPARPGRGPDRGRVLPASGHRAVLRLQDFGVRPPPGRRAVRAGRGEPDARLPRRVTVRRRSLPRGLRARVRSDPAHSRGDGAGQRQAHDPVLPDARRGPARAGGDGAERPRARPQRAPGQRHVRDPEQRDPGGGLRGSVRRLLDRLERPDAAHAGYRSRLGDPR
jgi:phosphohistidine swiveling domain-containing protein